MNTKDLKEGDYVLYNDKSIAKVTDILPHLNIAWADDIFSKDYFNVNDTFFDKINVIHLTLKKKWFDMIKSGKKKQEYREMKPFWDKRFEKILSSKKPTYIVLSNGYGKNVPKRCFELTSIKKGEYGKEEWGAVPGTRYWVLNIGEDLPIAF